MKSICLVRVRSWLGLLAGCLLAGLSLGLPPIPATGAPSTTPTRPVPLFAFYYIWFDTTSWDRAKIDYPQLGRYSSDDPRIMRQHIAWAKSAGIDGFIVSWKDNPTNDRRLRLLMDVARQMDFKLSMIYQGLDFDRNPLPAKQVAADFVMFRDNFAPDPVFYKLGGKPLTIWSGTWGFSHDEVAAVTRPVRDSMLVLNTEKSLDDYRRIAGLTDGDAYYWSSVNPDTNGNYGAKLNAMSDAIHRDGKYWIAPFAPGFDARLVGGSNVVDRKDGATLRTEYGMAARSSPDVLGLISWNEFSENSFVEPSQKYGTRYLDVLRELRDTPVPAPATAVDSSGEPPARAGSKGTTNGANGDLPSRFWPTALLIGFPVILALGVGVLAVRRRRDRSLAELEEPAELAGTDRQ